MDEIESQDYISFFALFGNVLSSCIGSVLFFGPGLMISLVGFNKFLILFTLIISFLIMFLIQIFLIIFSKDYKKLSQSKLGGILNYLNYIYKKNFVKYLFVFFFSFLYIPCSICLLTSRILNELSCDNKIGGIFIVAYYVIAALFVSFLTKYQNKISKILLVIQTTIIVSLFIILIVISQDNMAKNSTSYLYGTDNYDDFYILKFIVAITNGLYFFDGIQNFTFYDHKKLKNITFPLLLGTISVLFIYLSIFILFFTSSPLNCISPSLLTTFSTYFTFKTSFYLVSVFSTIIYSFPIFNNCLVSIKTLFLMIPNNQNENFDLKNTLLKLIIFIFILGTTLLIHYFNLANILVIIIGFTYCLCIFALAYGFYVMSQKKQFENLSSNLIKRKIIKFFLIFIMILTGIMTFTCIILTIISFIDKSLITKKINLNIIENISGNYSFANKTLSMSDRINTTEICLE